jgi:hypothetical protein
METVDPAQAPLLVAETVKVRAGMLWKHIGKSKAWLLACFHRMLGATGAPNVLSGLQGIDQYLINENSLKT